MAKAIFFLCLVASICSHFGFAFEPAPLQDFCVADFNSPGLNTLGISLTRIYYGPGGINPPHIHPRASEILTVTEGSLLVGFVTSVPDNRLITKVLQKGDVFVFPVGLVHFQRSVGNGYAAAWAALSSQNPGVITVANSVFGSNPSIPGEVLAKAFQVDKNIVELLQSKHLVAILAVLVYRVHVEVQRV
ncbi:hypothetical protein RJ640_015874 [Escallonia rubra]|uniref:Germin-like protein n=1 Tax=Escallonia rubra TaxID=112253 RepID=A0AA88R3N9_9ASTE|nr:hypothetical protein RJ640_015874 [Escallonia rubra]